MSVTYNGSSITTGTFREIELSKDNNSNYLNRQIIKDSNGNPFDLIVASDEGIRLTIRSRFSIDPNIHFSKILKLNLNGNTAGDITFSNGAVTKTITYSEMCEKRNFTVQYGGIDTNPAYTNKTFQQKLLDLYLPLDTTYPKVTHVYQKDSNIFYIFYNPANSEDLQLTIQSHTMTGGTGSPELTIEKSYNAPVSFQYLHKKIDGETTVEVPINCKLFPHVFVPAEDWYYFNVGLGWGNKIGYDGSHSMTRWDYPPFDYTKIWTNISEPSSNSVIKAPTVSSLTTERKCYWSPGSMGTGNKTINKIYLGNYSMTLFIILLDTDIVISDVEEFYFNVSWGVEEVK